jgi:hypothetical protein
VSIDAGQIFEKNEGQFWERLLADYAELSKNPFSLVELFPEIVEFCKGFVPHPERKESDKRVIAIAKKFGLWLKKFSRGSLTMTGFLHATSRVKPLDISGVFYNLLFNIDDTVTANADNPELNRERFRELQEFAYQLQHYLATGESPEGAEANGMYQCTRYILESLQEILVADLRAGQTAAFDWLARFMSVCSKHLKQALRHDNTADLGKNLTLTEFLEKRIDDSGMETTLMLMETSMGEYIDWKSLAMIAPELSKQLQRMRQLCALIAALVNDYFSFHKEVIAPPHSDFNFITILMRNENLSLKEAVIKGAILIRELFAEYLDLEQSVSNAVAGNNTTQGRAIRTHLVTLKEAIQATWVWELEGTERYLSDVTIFHELLAA